MEIIIRGDSGFCREALTSWCEGQGVEYAFGLEKNPRLNKAIDAELEQARRAYEDSGEATRVFKDFRYRTSTATLRANQLRLYMSSLAYCLLQGAVDWDCTAPLWPGRSATPSG